MLLNELEEKYREVVNEHIEKHENYKKYRFWAIFTLILSTLILLFNFIVIAITKFEDIENLAWGIVIIMFAYLYIEYKLKNKFMLKNKDKEIIYKELRSWFINNLHTNNINYFIEMIESEKNTKSKNYITNLVIAGTLFLGIWQGFVTLVLDQEQNIQAVLILGFIAFFSILIVKVIKDISYTFFKVINGRYDNLEKIAYYTKEYRLEIAKQKVD